MVSKKDTDLRVITQREVNKIGTDAQDSYRAGVKSYKSKIKSLQDLGKVLNSLTKSKDETIQDQNK